MAPKKKQSDALATTKTTALAVASWEELADFAKDEVSKEQVPTGNFISTRGGVLTIMGNPMRDNKAQVIVLASVYENVYYDGDFDADNPQPPACYAFSDTEDGLKPHEKVTEPQHDQCKGCELNEWGSAAKGRGKACKNSRRIAVISADGLSADTIEDTPVAIAKLPVTSVRGWAAYMQNTCRSYNRPIFGFVTEIALVPDPKTQFKWTFRMVEPIDASMAAALKARRDALIASGEMTAPYAEKVAVEVKKKPTKARKF